MFRTTISSVCLIAGMCQTMLAQGALSRETKSVGAAARYSVCGTIVPIVAGAALLQVSASNDESLGEGWSSSLGIVLGTVGIAGGPGLGHAYTGRWWHLAKGSLFRTAGAVLVIKGIVGSDPSGMGCWGKAEEECESDDGADAALIMVGGAIYLWSAIHDFGTLGRSVEHYNQKHSVSAIGVRPAYYTGSNAPGIVISLSF